MPTAGVDDDDFEALLLEHVDALGGDDDRIRFGVAAVERYSSFRRVLEKVMALDCREFKHQCGPREKNFFIIPQIIGIQPIIRPTYVVISAMFTTDIPIETKKAFFQLKPQANGSKDMT